MKHNQLLFIGTFQRPPEYNYIRTRCPDIRILPCTDLTQIPALVGASIIITSIGWLERLSKSDRKHLAQTTRKCSQWIGISGTGLQDDAMLRWLESGVNYLLPPEFEQPLCGMLAHYKPVTAEGLPLHIQRVLEEINTQKTSGNKISGSLNLFRQMFDTSDYCMAIADSFGKVVFINPAYTQVMGYSPTEVVGRNCRELLCCDAVIASQLVDTLLREKKNWKGTTKRQRKDGSEFISLNLAGPIHDELGTITHLYITFTDITQELQNQQDLTHAKATAEQANQAKSEFLSRMSHELRTPMNAVLGFAQLLQQNPELPPVLQHDVGEIFKAGNHLLQLINDLLDLSKIESGQIGLVIEEVSLNHVIAECEALLRPMAQTRQIRLQSENIQECRLFTDQLRLKQVILNLLTNAIIYSPSGEEVKISPLVSDNNRIRIEFIDNGPGIPASQIDELFIPFKRLDQTSAKVEGSGIGLTISQELVELMGGQIGVSSQPGAGSVFWFELPVDPEPGSHLVTQKQTSTFHTRKIGNEFETYLK